MIEWLLIVAVVLLLVCAHLSERRTRKIEEWCIKQSEWSTQVRAVIESLEGERIERRNADWRKTATAVAIKERHK